MNGEEDAGKGTIRTKMTKHPHWKQEKPPGGLIGLEILGVVNTYGFKAHLFGTKEAIHCHPHFQLNDQKKVHREESSLGGGGGGCKEEFAVGKGPGLHY